MPYTALIILTPGDYLLAKDSQTKKWLKAFSCSRFVSSEFLTEEAISSYILKEINSQKNNAQYTECIFDENSQQRIDQLLRFNEDFVE